MPYVDDGISALVFTSDGDMRQALNSLQATHAGFGLVNQENVFKVKGGVACRSAGAVSFFIQSGLLLRRVRNDL